jgi:hypothetical protein
MHLRRISIARLVGSLFLAGCARKGDYVRTPCGARAEQQSREAWQLKDH